MSHDDATGSGYLTSDITRITVLGGVSRMDADTTDMAQAARLVATAAGHLATARTRCSTMLARISGLEMLALMGWGPLGQETAQASTLGAAVHLDHAETSLRLARSALQLQIADLDELAVGTLGAAEAYRGAETAAETGMLDVAGGVSSWLFFSPLALASSVAIGTAQAGGTSWRDRFTGGLSTAVGMLNPFREPFSTPGIDDAAEVIGVGYGAVARGTGPATLTLKGLLGWPLVPQPRLDYRPGHLVETTTTVAPITSALDAADAVGDLPAGSVSVLRTAHLDGTETWAVFIRGTDVWDPGSNSPFAGAANLDLMAGGDSDSMALVESALQQAGAPVGAAVGLYGHSQGGIAAMRLSDDPVFRRRYDLRSVTTFGAPTAAIVQSAPVPTLHVENNQEWVSSLDASVAPATVDRVTVSADLPDHEGSTHGMSTHRQVLDAAIRQGDPAVLYAVEQQQAVLGDPAYAGSTTIPLPDVEITVFTPGSPPAPAGAPPSIVTTTPSPPAVPADLWAAPEPPLTADGAIDWDEATRRAHPGPALPQVGGG